jgi:hypothetical protein
VRKRKKKTNFDKIGLFPSLGKRVTGSLQERHSVPVNEITLSKESIPANVSPFFLS